MIVNATELRKNLRIYLAKLEKGEEITIIRRSVVIGRIVPPDTIRPEPAQQADSLDTFELEDGRKVKFHQFGAYEDPEQIIKLHSFNGSAPGLDLRAPGDHYGKLNGEFWIGELDGELVDTGAFQLCLESHAGADEAELKRLMVKPELQDEGIDEHMLKLLKSRARKKGYKSLRLSQKPKNLV